jgi:undecaprenyl diphosphate synthase
MPRHIAIIMDGNGRWAKLRGMPRVMGHRQGVLALKPIVKACAHLGVNVLTVYAFSTENWARPATEVDGLMDLLVEFLRSETQELKQEGVSIRTIGDIGPLAQRVQRALEEAVESTAQESRMILNLAVNYGGRDELIRAVNRWLSTLGTKSREGPLAVTQEVIARHLDSAGMPDPDLLIRAGGEARVSNFMLWQIAYTEFYVTDTLWPDFDPRTLAMAIRSFQSRSRRFGALES